MSWRWLCCGFISACLLLSFVGQPATAGEPRFAQRVAKFVPSSSSPGELVVDAIAGTDGSRSVAVAIWGLSRRGDVVASGLIVGAGGYQAPETNVLGPKVGCVTLPVQPVTLCQSRVAGTIMVRVTVPPSTVAQLETLVVALTGDSRIAQIRLAPQSKHWKMRGLARSVQILRTQDLNNTYVISSSESVEHFQSAHVRGGPHGSLVAAGVPCRAAVIAGMSTGQGAARLTGGSTPQDLSCPTGPITAFAASSKPTVWRLDGDIWGSTNSAIQAVSKVQEVSWAPEDIRLFEVDGPF